MNAVDVVKDRPAHVAFERVPVEDKIASLQAGHYVAKDVDFAVITPSYSKDRFKQKIPAWLQSLEADVRNGRIPQAWSDQYLEAYKRWQNGQEIPLNGTAIKGWGVISPAQQEILIKMNILTVEDLGGINDEGIRRIGMGSIDLKNKAKAWLAQLQDKGPLTLEIAALKAENTLLQGSIQTLTERVEKLLVAGGVPTVAQIQAPRAMELPDGLGDDIPDERS